MDEDFGTQWGHWCAVVIKSTSEVCFGQHLWAGFLSAEDIEGGCALLHKAIPEVDEKVGVDTAQTSNKVVFPSTDGFFGGIGLVVMRGH